jgi:hypothetical protein
MSEWIKCSDRMPVIERRVGLSFGSVNVICCTSSKQVIAMSYAQSDCGNTAKSRAPRFEWNGRISPWEVTHWQYLPAPPEAS